MELRLAFSSGDSFIDKGIKFAEEQLEHDTLAPQPLATHAYLLFSTTTGTAGIEAVPPRVHLWDAQKNPRPSDRGYRVPCTDAQARAVCEAATKRLGTFYDFPGFVVVLAFLAFKVKDRFYQNRHASVFCSEFVTDCLREGGISLLNTIPACDVTPALLETWAMLHFSKE